MIESPALLPSFNSQKRRRRRMEDQVVYNTTSVVYTQHSTIPPQWDILGQFHAKITGKSNHRKKNIVKREFF